MQIVVISAVFLALLLGESAGETLKQMSYFSGVRTVALLAGSMFLLWSLMTVTVRSVLIRLERFAQVRSPLSRLPGRVDLIMRTVVLGLFAVQLTIGGWADMVCAEWQLTRFVLLDELMLLLPFVLMLLMKWYCFYPVNRFVRQHVVAGRLSRGDSARPAWSRRQYLSFQIRHSLLLILVPLFLILAHKDIVELIALRWFANGDKLLLTKGTLAMMTQSIVLAGGVMIIIFSPLLLRRIWVTRSLPSGQLRDRLEEFCRRIGFKCNDILLWDTYSAVSNAAVMGLFGRVRYVLITDAQIENMGDEQIEAVFGHEVGHVKHHHILFLMLFVAGTGGVATLLFELLLKNQADQYSDWPIFALGTALATLWLLSFGYVSRRFERQADVYAATSVSSQDRPTGKEGGLDNHGAAVMAGALMRIATLNGIPPDTRSFRHSSIALRMAFLTDLATRRNLLTKFKRNLKLIKITIVACIVTAIIGWHLIGW